MSRVENLLIEQVGKSVSLFGPNHLLNLLKITNLLVYLTLLVYLAPESSAIHSQIIHPMERFISLNLFEIL